MEKDTIKTEEMTDHEIKKAIKYFLVAAPRLGLTFEHAEPGANYCYCSSSYIIGVYFPNTTIQLNQEHKNFYKFVAVCKVGGLLGVCYRLKEEHHTENGRPKGFLYEFIFKSFEGLFYGEEFPEIIKELETKRGEYLHMLEQSKTIKRVCTKSGADFARLAQNFNPAPMLTEDLTICDFYYSVRLYNENGFTSADQIAEHLQKYQEKTQNEINEINNSINKLRKTYPDFKKMLKDIKKYINNSGYWCSWFLKEYIKKGGLL